MFCRYCGQQVPDDGSFCPSCGKALYNTPKTEPVKQPTTVDTEQIEAFAPPSQEIRETPQPKGRKAFQKVATILTRVAIPINAVAFGAFVFSIFLIIVCFIETGDSYLEALEMTNIMLYLATTLIAIGSELSIVAFVFSRIQKEDANIKRRALGVFVGGIVLLVLISVCYGFFIGYFGVSTTMEFSLGSGIFSF